MAPCEMSLCGFAYWACEVDLPEFMNNSWLYYSPGKHRPMSFYCWYLSSGSLSQFGLKHELPGCWHGFWVCILFYWRNYSEPIQMLLSNLCCKKRKPVFMFSKFCHNWLFSFTLHCNFRWHIIPTLWFMFTRIIICVWQYSHFCFCIFVVYC